MQRAYYSKSIENFKKDSLESILGSLSLHHQHSLEDLQKNAWKAQVQILKESLKNIHDGNIYFEFSIPRMGKRVDNILIINGIIFVLEFKIGAHHYLNADVEQAMDYCLDLKNFHEGSHSKPIVPILVSTNGESISPNISFKENGIAKCVFANRANLGSVITSILSKSNFSSFCPVEWEHSIYKPTPTIVEAAQALYSGHDVKEISRSDASAKNLSLTSECIQKIISDSKNNNSKSIIFVTGVPGAGKTLAGLNIATNSMDCEKDEHAVFLSGNGPLVEVLREALAREQSEKESISKTVAMSKVKAFIQNIHHFRDDGLRSNNAPVEKVVIFDEAQRAWNQEQASKFMQRKKGVASFEFSEPEFLIDVMNRHQDWCVIVCLIGGGQEINTGEAGLIEWFNSIKRSYPEWAVFCSDQINKNEYISNIDILDYLPNRCSLHSDLHLAVSVRSFRSENLSKFVHEVIADKPGEAQKTYQKLSAKYPIFITRDLSRAKSWVKEKAQGSERFGLITSSNAIRLKPEGINIKDKIDPPIWFLNDKNDIRSSYFLEDVATEFDIQGLELDWTIVAWDANLRYYNDNWNFFNFVGTKWQNINKNERKQYLLNAYRVLLTRARQGMIIYVPSGDIEDETRKPKYYDGIYNYLLKCGIQPLKADLSEKQVKVSIDKNIKAKGKINMNFGKELKQKKFYGRFRNEKEVEEFINIIKEKSPQVVNDLLRECSIRTFKNCYDYMSNNYSQSVEILATQIPNYDRASSSNSSFSLWIRARFIKEIFEQNLEEEALELSSKV